ncbi:hypothetical protein WJX77_009812 [Trebouxia sp. C0004]
MWNVWHGSKLERRLFGNKGKKQPLLSGHQGNAEATQQYADLMWRASSPQGYQPPDMHTAHDFTTDSATAGRRNLSYRQQEPLRSPFQQSSRLDMSSQAAPRSNDQQHQSALSQHFAGTDSNSADSTRPGTPPTNAGGLGNHSFADLEYGYQQLLEPLLPTGDLLHSSGQAPAQHSAQDQQVNRRDQAHRTGSFLIMPAVPAPSSPLQRPPSHHSHSPQPSEHSHGNREPSHGNLQGLNVPLEPHERQLLNNLLHRSHSTRSQDRGSDHSQSSTSTHHDGQPLSLPRTWSARRLTTGSLMMHDTSNLQDPQDLPRQMKRIGSGQLMVTEGDKVMLPANLGLIGASRMAPQQTQHQQLLLHSIQEDGSSQVHAVPMRRAPELGLQYGEAARMWKEQVKWVLLWFTLSLLTCMHSAALILALQYNLIAMAFGGMFCISGVLGIYGSCATLAGYCMSRHFGIAGVNVFKLKQMEVLAFTTMVISALAAIIHFASVNIIHNEGTGAVPGGHICNPGDVACEQNYNFVIVMMVSTTVLYGCHAIVSATLAFKAHAVRRAVRQHPEPMLM